VRIGWEYRRGVLTLIGRGAEVRRSAFDEAQWTVWKDGTPTAFKSYNKVAAQQYAEEIAPAAEELDANGEGTGHSDDPRERGY